VALADVYEVLTANRPYRSAHTHAAAIDQLKLMSGNQFDPGLVDPFVEVIDEYRMRHGEGGDAAYRASLHVSAVLRSQEKVRRLVAQD
jgi:HD-GYP domain-containing protein (c-di-GMP phosphodiesterase class II)